MDAEKIGKDSVTGDLLAVTLRGWGFLDPKSLSSSPPPIYLQIATLLSLLGPFNLLLFLISGLLPSPVALHTTVLEISLSSPPAELIFWFPSSSQSVRAN